MNESHRMAYLQAMGVDQYYPRRVLPQAKPSPPFRFDEQAPRQMPNPAPRKKASPGKPAAGTREHSPRGEPDKERAHPRQTAAAEPGFVLEYLRINDNLAVIADRPTQASSEQRRQAGDMLQGILRAIDCHCGDRLPPADHFSWPPAADRVPVESRLAAAKALQGFIRRKQKQDGFTNLLVFTGQLGPLLRQDGNEEGEDFAVRFTGGDLSLTLCHSVYAMLAVPALKRETWQWLQALRRRLQDHG